MRAPAPPVFGIFNSSNLTVGQIPFEIEKRVSRSKLELESELKEARKIELEKLSEKLRIGSEICVQEEREKIIERSKILAKNPHIFNRTKYLVLKAANEMLNTEMRQPKNSNIFDGFDAAQETIPKHKIEEIQNYIELFLVKYKENLDETIKLQLSEERKTAIDHATDEALRITSEWDALTKQDSVAIHETLLNDAKMQHNIKLNSHDTINNISSLYSIYERNAFDSTVIFAEKEISRHPSYEKQLFRSDTFLEKAMR